MRIRDAEIERLIHYLKALGAKVIIRNYIGDYSGEIDFEPKYLIKVNKRQHRNKTDIIMTLLHEASHLKYAILNNYKFSDSFLNEVWELEEQGKKVPKKFTKDIVQFELESLELMPNIASELSIKVPMKKILKQKELDQFMYKILGEKGVFPTTKEIKLQNKKLKEKYKK